MEQVVVSLWKTDTETTYLFGPFKSSEQALAWADKLTDSNPHYQYESMEVQYLNPPESAGTGLEVS